MLENASGFLMQLLFKVLSRIDFTLTLIELSMSFLKSFQLSEFLQVYYDDYQSSIIDLPFTHLHH